jgi:hypothetical protein
VTSVPVLFVLMQKKPYLWPLLFNLLIKNYVCIGRICKKSPHMSPAKLSGYQSFRLSKAMV